MDTPMEPGHRLLCACARSAHRPPDRGLVHALLREEIDWARLLPLAARHRMLPFLFRHLRGESLPAHVASRLLEAYESNTARNLAMIAACVRLVRGFDAAGIRTIAFKGPVTAYALYGDLGLRGFTDLDLIVAPHDVPQARQVLDRLGLSPEVRLGPAQEQALLHYRHELTFSTEDGSFHLDLHWRLLVPHLRMTQDEGGVWDRSVTVDLAGARVRTLGPGDSLAYACVRAAVDSWATLYRIVDIAEAAAAAGGEVGEALGRATQVGRRGLMLVGLLLASELLQAPLDPSIVEEARSLPRVVAAACEGRAAMFAPEAPSRSLLSRDRLLRTVIEGPKARLECLLFLPFSPGPSDVGLLNLPRPLWGAYRLVRLVRALALWVRGRGTIG